MQIKTITLFIVIWCLSTVQAVHASKTKETCDVVRATVDDMQNQLPLAVDYVTDLVGMSVLYVQSVCNVSYMYIVKTELFAKAVSKENGLSLEENMLALKTEEGAARLKISFKKRGEEARLTELEVFETIPNMLFIYRHGFDEPGIQTIKTIVLDTRL